MAWGKDAMLCPLHVQSWKNLWDLQTFEGYRLPIQLATQSHVWLSTSIESKHRTFVPRSKICIHIRCFRVTCSGNSNTCPKGCRPRCVGIRHLVSTFRSRLSQRSEFDDAATRLCRCSSTVTVPAVAARGNVSRKKHQLGKRQLRSKGELKRSWVMHKSLYRTFGT